MIYPVSPLLTLKALTWNDRIVLLNLYMKKDYHCKVAGHSTHNRPLWNKDYFEKKALKKCKIKLAYES